MVYETSSCQMCPNVDTCDMVQCDSCDLWYHFVCVGVTRTIASKDWDCDRCKYALPENPFFDKYEKENRPPEIRWRKTQSIASLSSVSSRRNSVLALKKLEEERALREKRDHEYLQQKYSILEDLIDDSGEHRTKDQIFDDKQSFENTLQWANKMQNLSEDYANKFKVNDISISFDEDERTAMNQRFFPLAQSSTNVRRPKSGLSSENDGKTSVPATHQKPLDPSVSEFEQLRSKLFEDSAKTTIKTVGAASTELPRQCTNPFIDSNNFRFNETEVLSAKPLQSKLIDNKLKSNFNVIDSSESLLGGVQRRELRTNFIQPSKLQLNKKSNSTIGKLRTDPIQTSKLQFQDQPNLGGTEINPALSEIRSNAEFNDNNQRVSHDNFKFDFGSKDFSHDVKRPKIDFDRFGFSKIKPSLLRSKPYHSFADKSRSLAVTTNNSPTGPTNFTPNRPSNAIGQVDATSVGSTNFIPSSLSQHSLINSSKSFEPIDFRKICHTFVELTKNQIASRHTMNRRLPQFFGEPTKWQMFESAFVHSTTSCGLMNHENLSRLLDSLQGVAMDAVKSRLLHPDSVPGVMETLRLMYGRPELVIQSLLEEINKTTPPKSDDLGSLIKFSISVKNLCATIESFGAVEHLRNPNLIKALTDKLPSQIQLNWAFYKHQIREINVSILGDWLYELATIASDVVTVDMSADIKKARKETECFKNSKQNNYINVQNGAKAEVKSTKYSVASSKNSQKCLACKKDICKVLAYCEEFKRLKRQDRWKLVKSSNICGCCLGNHRYFNCQQKVPCGIAGCSFFHHVLLHNDKNVDELANRVSNSDASQKTSNSMKGNVLQSRFPDLFRIVPVKLFFNGKSIRIYAYLDDGSNLTTLAMTVSKKLGLCGTKESLCVKWSFGETQVEANSSRVSVQISGVHEGAEMFLLEDVRTVEELKLPMQSITKGWLSKYSYFNGIPITPYDNAIPQLIIGLQYSKLMVSLETIEGNWQQPIACKTRLGWIIQGPNDRKISTDRFNEFSLNVCECQASDNNLQQLVKGFFSLESFDVKISDRVIGSKQLMRAHNILESSTIKKGNHYEAALLWRKDGITLPKSYDMAKRRLECVESKMKQNPVLAERICDYFKDFLSKDYIRKLSVNERQKYGPRTWYLPVFPVFNAKKPDKLRLVWDGAAKVKGISLNSELLAGPDQLVPLPDILRRFREGCIGLSTDIIEMFHRIYVNEKDQDSQRFLWRDGNADMEPDVFVVKVLTFGSTCSPAIAQFVKNKNAKDFESEFPKAVEAIIKNHYVDDMIERVHDVESAVKLIRNVQFIHHHANFDLRNLVSNNQQVLQAINGSPEFNDKILVNKLDIDVERILGMYWNTKTDTFTYSLQFIKLKSTAEEYCPTKREVLRIVMSVFDPLGFLAHFLIHAKVLLQEIWRNDIGWDVQLPISLRDKWFKWVHHLMEVEHLHIPRLYSARLSPNRPKSIQLHIFVDASSEAYATSAYFRIEDDDGVDSSIVGAKSRVAPNRPISIPRLELQGAVLGNRFAESILQSHYSLDIEKTIIWCDSKTVLFWLNSEPRRYSQFVAFRIGEILDSKINAQWRWIPSDFNVADEATKTKKLPELISSSRWFVGPEFLRNSNPEFCFELDEPVFTTEEEIRPYYLLTHLEVPVSKLFNYERFSNWQRLLRAMAYVLRFIQNSKLKLQDRSFGFLSSKDLLAAENCLYRQIQYDCFKEEILIIR